MISGDESSARKLYRMSWSLELNELSLYGIIYVNNKAYRFQESKLK